MEQASNQSSREKLGPVVRQYNLKRLDVYLIENTRGTASLLALKVKIHR